MGLGGESCVSLAIREKTVPAISLISLSLIAVALGQPSDGSPGVSTTQLVSSRIEDRLIKRFDFDERGFGNYETMPMNWRRIEAPGHPRFLEPGFDLTVGHLATPSFKLPLAGGSLGCYYLAKDIHVHPDSDYQITAWVKTDKVAHARAYLTAYFLDHALQKIDSSERRSVVVRDSARNADWRSVDIVLPGGFMQARWIGLACHLEQPDEQRDGPKHPRPIHHQDIHATAWFDDITVWRLPQAVMTLGSVDHVFTHDQPIDCRVTVSDFDGRNMTARLSLLDVRGQVVQSHPVESVSAGRKPPAIPLIDIPAGRYTARLTVEAEGTELLRREQSFIKLNPPLTSIGRGHSGLGIVLGPAAAAHIGVTTGLLKVLSPDSVKLTVWRKKTDDEAIVWGDRNVDQLVNALHERGIDIVGILAEPPSSLVEQLGHPDHSLFDVLTAPASPWRSYLALLLTRYGERIQAWQLGDDRRPESIDPRQLVKAIANVRAELRPLVGASKLVAPHHVEWQLTDAARQADVISLTLPAHLVSSRLVEQLASISEHGDRRLWATVEPLDPVWFNPRSRWIEWARRLVVARQAGVDTVFVPEPWTIEHSEAGEVASPQIEAIYLRTLVQTLGRLAPQGPVWLDHGVAGWLFADKTTDTGAIVAWTDADEPSPRGIRFDAGPTAQRIDLLGNVAPLDAVEDGVRLEVDAMPIVIAPVSAGRARTVASFAVVPPNLEVTTEGHDCRLLLRNELPTRIAGVLHLEALAGWRVSPRRLVLDLASGQESSQPLKIIVPYNQPSGDFALLGRMDIENTKPARLNFRAPVFVRGADLDMNVVARLADSRLNIWQRITNRSGRALDLRSVVVYPDRLSASRTIRNLADGETTVREYELANAQSLVGRPIRVSVEAADGSLRQHQVITLD